MFCSNCGLKRSEGEKFCSNCGFALQKNVTAPTAPISPSYQYQDSLQVKKEGTTYVVLGWIFFAISFLFIPILFGAGTVIMGYLLRKNNRETHGTIMIILGVAGGILGVLFGIAVTGY